MIASELTNPSIVKVFKSDANYFLYGKEKFQFTGRFSITDAEIRHLASAEKSWIKRDSAVYKEISKQWETIGAEKAEMDKRKAETIKAIESLVG